MVHDGIVLEGNNQAWVNRRRLDEWRFALERKGLKISRSKTEYREYEFEVVEQVIGVTKRVMTISENTIGEVEIFKYLESFVQKNGGFDEQVKHRIKCEWIEMLSSETSGVLYNKKMQIMLKGKFYKSLVKTNMLYGLECWTVHQKIEQRMSVAKMKILRWMSGMMREDRIREKYVRENIGVTSIVD